MDLKRPKWVWVIAVFCILAGASQLFSHTTIISGIAPLDVKAQAVVASWSLLDKITPFVLSTVLLIGAIALLGMRKIAFELYATYLVLVTVATIKQAITTDWIEQFGAYAWSAIAGLALFGVIVWYVYHLRSNGKLR